MHWSLNESAIQYMNCIGNPQLAKIILETALTGCSTLLHIHLQLLIFLSLTMEFVPISTILYNDAIKFELATILLTFLYGQHDAALIHICLSKNICWIIIGWAKRPCYRRADKNPLQTRATSTESRCTCNSVFGTAWGTICGTGYDIK